MTNEINLKYIIRTISGRTLEILVTAQFACAFDPVCDSEKTCRTVDFVSRLPD